MIIDDMILVVLQGVVEDQELLEAQADMFLNPAFQGYFPRLIDATGVTMMRLSADVIRHVSRSSYDRGLRKSAMVTNQSDVVYGLMRMYAGYTAEAEVEVFRDRKLAIKWLESTLARAGPLNL